MPVGTVSRSQIAQPHFPTFELFSEFWFRSLKAWTPEQGEIISSVEGAVSGEVVKEGAGGWVRKGGISYSFTPSHLRTSYRLTDLTVTLPKLEWTLSAPAEGEPEGEWEFAQNWIAILRIGGATYFIGEPAAATTFTLKSVAITGGVMRIPPKVIQVQFQESIVAVPGATIEVEIVPFIQVTRVIKSTKLKGLISNAQLAPAKEAPPQAATLVYEQRFEPSRKRE